MADLPNILVASLKPDTRKEAEKALTVISNQPGFLGGLLQLILNSSQDRSARLAASIYLKNIAKTRWEEVCLPASFMFFVFNLGCIGGSTSFRTGQDGVERTTGTCHA